MGRPDEDMLEDGRPSRRRKYGNVVRKRPGLAPSAPFQLMGHTIFLRVSDAASGLPPYEEWVLLSSINTEEDATGYLQRSASDGVAGTLRVALASRLKRLPTAYLESAGSTPAGHTLGARRCSTPRPRACSSRSRCSMTTSSIRRSRRWSTSSPRNGNDRHVGMKLRISVDAVTEGTQSHRQTRRIPAAGRNNDSPPLLAHPAPQQDSLEGV